MRLLVFQHTQGETPAAFGTHARAAGDEIHVVPLYADAVIPDLTAFDALLVMGGPMDIWEHDKHPWLIPEKAAIRDWIATNKPYLGICLGHQLLAEAAGGSCKLMAIPEIAVSDVNLVEARQDPVLGALPMSFAAMHWHGVEVSVPPRGAQVLGHSTGCRNQAMRVGESAWGLQFHPELESGTLTGWMRDPGNLMAAADWLGSEAAAWDFVRDAEHQTTEFMARSGVIYSRWRSLC